MDSQRPPRAPRRNPLPATRTGSTLIHQPIDSSALCLRCGYELRGLDTSGPCPECGFPIAESLERRRLGLSSPAYLASLRTGAALTIGALGLSIIAGFARTRLLAMAFAPGTQPLFIGLDLAAAALLVWGVWMLTIDDPGLHQRDQARPNKRAMRVAAAGLLVIAIMEFALALRVAPLMPGPTLWANSLVTHLVIGGMTFGSLACWLILATGLVNYTRWLAVRVPDIYLLRTARTIGWMLPIAIVLAFGASLFFGTATRLLPIGLMTFLVGAARERIQPDQAS